MRRRRRSASPGVISLTLLLSRCSIWAISLCSRGDRNALRGFGRLSCCCSLSMDCDSSLGIELGLAINRGDARGGGVGRTLRKLEVSALGDSWERGEDATGGGLGCIVDEMPLSIRAVVTISKPPDVQGEAHPAALIIDGSRAAGCHRSRILKCRPSQTLAEERAWSWHQQQQKFRDDLCGP
jgi:hypothetical protein